MAGRDDEESFMSLEDEVVKPIKSKTQKKAKKPCHLPPQEKKACQKHRKCFVLVSQVFMSCEFVFLYIAGENMIFFKFFAFSWISDPYFLVLKVLF